MESSEFNEFDSISETNVDTIILTLPSTFSEEDQPSNSEIMKSECGQFFLVTYDATNKIISKHQIHLQINAEECLELKCSDDVVEGPVLSGKISVLDSQVDVLASLPDGIDDRCQAGDALQLAMQEIDCDTDLLEPVPYEIKLAALNAMIPAGENPEQTEHFGLNIFLCPVCGRQFSHSSNLSRHLRIHSGAKPYKCKDCGRRFNQANSLHTHRAYIHAGHNKRHGCPLCGRLYKTLQLLKRHCKINHQDENVDLSVPPSVMAKRQFYCSDCGENFSQKSLLMKHKEAEHAVIPSTDEIQPIDIVAIRESPCNDVQLFDAMDSIDSMLREIQDGNNAPISMDLVVPKVMDTDTVTQTIEDVINKINKFICFECGKQFHRYMSYKQHWGVHETSLRKFECKECGMAFAWKSTYVKHTMQFHSSEPPIVMSCNEPDCGKEYKSLSQLQEHIKRDHQMIRRFSCDECNKQFYKAHDLLVHKRTHSKEKPYMCGTCGKSFSHISHVIRHEKSHNNIRPHTCPVCHKSFTQATVLRAHRKKKCPDPITSIPNKESETEKSVT
ncbi:zinc finger protein 70-like isoform X2 [Daphnia pulex]|uniref:zinc finger protein 70-like isoform X2 n=1 Tax=Daphnia pulex TaxID=6669 RepID=UPI001EDFC631|nr:zinc finger protein 70-like isoform X2 [Daphnia pulex]